MTLTDFIAKFTKDRGYSPRVGFIGLGVSNLALLERIDGIRITVRDRKIKDRVKIPSTGSVRIFEGGDYLTGIDEDILVLSPSVRRDTPEIHDAARRGVILTSDAELYFLDSPGRDYLVTGSDGKSTTATLAALLLEEASPGIDLIGNIGKPFSSGKSSPAVAELSSFQLSYMTPPSRAAVITTITPNHLNWHASLEEYIDAKVNIAKNTERLVLSPDTEKEEALIPILRPRAIYSVIHTLSELKSAYPSTEDFVTLEGDSVCLNDTRLLSIDEIKRRERHNIHNLMGAVALTAGSFSIGHLKAMASAFSGLEHRMEKFASYRGVDFINSSIDTTPARTCATLESLSRPVRIILGGGAKGLSILPLIPTLSKFASRIALYGEAGEKYRAELCAHGWPVGKQVQWSEKFDSALDFLLEGLCEGETILLSPAATGYGEFLDFKDRGIHFKEYIKKLYSR